jgi:transforming growth factor-beta-induced protein
MKTILTSLTAMAAFTSAHAGDNCRHAQSTHTTIQTQAPACQASGLISGTAHHSTTGHVLIAHPSPNAAAVTNQKKDIVDTAVAAGSFNTLVAAVRAAGLVETLKGDGPFTVFAPTDEAFAKLPQSTIADLLKPENKDQLIAILTYHVVPGKVLAADVVKIKSAKPVNGKEVNVMAEGNGVMINKAQVVAADVETSNGVIHVIDSVLLP